jgi:hypothetical protein
VSDTSLVASSGADGYVMSGDAWMSQAGCNNLLTRSEHPGIASHHRGLGRLLIIDDAQQDVESYARYRRRMIKRLGVWTLIIAGLGAFIMLALMGKLPPLELAPSMSGTLPPNAVYVDFGLSRAQQTRIKSVTYTSQPSTANSSVQTPSVVSATLAGDLLDSADNSQFPASAVQLSGSPSGRGRLQLTVIVEPFQGEFTGGGTYRGTITILADNDLVQVPLVLYLAPRDGVPATLAFTLLLVGATVGLSVKWITESLSRLATARWRLEDLKRSIGGDLESLPVMATVHVQEIHDRVRRQDTDDLDQLFTPLLSSVYRLRTFSLAIQTAKQEVIQQERLAVQIDDTNAPYIDEDFVHSIVRVEGAQIERLRAIDWPWSEPESVLAKAEAVAQQFRIGTIVLSDVVAGRADAKATRVLQFYRSGSFDEGYMLYYEPAAVVTEQAEGQERPRGPVRRRERSYLGPERFVRFVRFRRSDERGVVSWMAQRPKGLAGAASVLVVSLVGLQLQYLNVPTFSGELAHWLGLLLWAAVVELSGVSVLDVLSRLGGGSVSAGSGGRRLNRA